MMRFPTRKLSFTIGPDILHLGNRSAGQLALPNCHLTNPFTLGQKWSDSISGELRRLEEAARKPAPNQVCLGAQHSIDGIPDEVPPRPVVVASGEETSRQGALATAPHGPAPLLHQPPWLYGLMITKDDFPIFGDWCEDQLRLYDGVVCLDGSAGDETARIAAKYPDRLVYLHEREFEIPHKTDHGLRRIVHQEIVRRFGAGHWIMCCHPDEFCYHDPRMIAAKADREGYDRVSWFSLHFYPHPDEWADWDRLSRQAIPQRHRHYHWSYRGDGFPWCEDRLYRDGPGVGWDDRTHGSVRPHGLARPAPFHPIYRHYKVLHTDPVWYDAQTTAAPYRTHWVGLADRTGVPFLVRRCEDLFVRSVRNYDRCDRFDGTFLHPWNMGEEFRPEPQNLIAGEIGRRLREVEELAAKGEIESAARILSELDVARTTPQLRAMARNNEAALAAVRGDRDVARSGFAAALELDPQCAPARANLVALEGESRASPLEANPRPLPGPGDRATRIAVLSLLFNWPSTGGGNVHSAELTKFLAAAGYNVKHLVARFDPWRLGKVIAPTPYPVEAIEFAPTEWTAAGIVARFRRAVDEYNPDWVILTDSWNLKPLLATAAGGRPYILRLQALECLCPLNNVRLLPSPEGRPTQCNRHQLATPDICARCVRDHANTSGDLHRAERALAGVGTPEYQDVLFRAFAGAHAVFVVNPLTAAMVEPYARDVRVVTAGMDPSRFPWPFPSGRLPPPTPGRLRILFAGLTQEWMKGFAVLQEACGRLWQSRQDFELVVTDGPPSGQIDPFTRYVGWQSQTDLPAHIAGADIVVVPTIAQEALGRTAVEAMAAGRPVVASQLGGLSFTVMDGATGLLCEPGNPADLAAKLARLLDDAELRGRLGEAGRRRFVEQYSWPVIIEKHYRPLFGLASTAKEIATRHQSPPPPPSASVGCVLAIRDRSADLLERVFQTYRWQALQPSDQVLVDYGSDPAHTCAYRSLCQRYGWRLVRTDPSEPRWSLSRAYNLAVASLREGIEVVFKSDADILIGPEVLATASRLGANTFCQFQYLTMPKDFPCPEAFVNPGELKALAGRLGKDRPSVGQGLFACPAEWFRRVGGFDHEFRAWGYEDHDLRLRAERSLKVIEVDWRDALLLHHWHPAAVDSGSTENLKYFERARVDGPVIRNGGQLLPPNLVAQPAEGLPAALTGPSPRWNVVVTTRSMSSDLYHLSGEFLRFDPGGPSHRVRYTGTDATDYFSQLATLDADWVINLDEDAFLLDPPALMDLIRRMEADGYAACGMPDGGVVSIRQHNPVVCNAFFNVFDLRRVRRAWADWERARGMRHRPEFERVVAPFAKRTPFQFDDFEPYYGVFFSLLAADERILYLDAEQWRDGTSTVIRTPTGEPLVLHCWYARLWPVDLATRRRYAIAATYAHDHQSQLGAPHWRSPPEVETRAALARTLVAVVVYNRVQNADRWLTAWGQTDRGGAKFALIHNQDRLLPGAEAIFHTRPEIYLPRENVGQDIGAFQDLLGGQFDKLLPDWEFLLWCTDDFLPVRADFLLRFVERMANPRVGLVAGRYGYWPGNWSGRAAERHCRTVGFLIRREVARRLTFPAVRLTTRDECRQFEHHPGHMTEQVLGMGYLVSAIDDPDGRIMWDLGHEAEWERWSDFHRSFPR